MTKIQSASSIPGKETVYVDVDDEITAIIDKVESAKGKVIALVLPKRATVLQSVVNMKLLKRTSDNADKNLVLITTEASLMPIAGVVGLYVASTPNSKPSIPSSPISSGDETEDVDEPINITYGPNSEPDFDPNTAASKSVGELATSGAVASSLQADDDSTIDMANYDTETPVTDIETPTKKPKKLKKDKKLKVPNFDGFKKKLAIIVVLLALLCGGFIFAAKALPKATIEIKTDTSTIPTNINLALSTSISKLDIPNNTIPAVAQSQQKSATQQVPATGQQNNGELASGTVTVTNCSGSSFKITAGSSLTASGHTFIVQSGTVVPDSNYTSPQSGSKCKSDGKATVDITALKGGADYNIDSSSASLSNKPSGVSAQTSSTSGGTDDIVKIVNQSDIDSATNQIKAADTSDVSTQLATSLQAKGQMPIKQTFIAGSPLVTSSAKAGDAADTVTVTAATTYTMLGVQKSDLQSIIMDNVGDKIDKSKQVTLDDGVASAKFTAQGAATTTGATLAMSAKTVAGPQLNVGNLKKQLAGKKSGDVKRILTQTPGVTSVDVKLSPFWVSAVPSDASKVTINIDKVSS